jgi:hypothetical protein
MEKEDARRPGHADCGRDGIQSDALKGAISDNEASVLKQGRKSYSR